MQLDFSLHISVSRYTTAWFYRENVASLCWPRALSSHRCNWAQNPPPKGFLVLPEADKINLAISKSVAKSKSPEDCIAIGRLKADGAATKVLWLNF